MMDFSPSFFPETISARRKQKRGDRNRLLWIEDSLRGWCCVLPLALNWGCWRIFSCRSNVMRDDDLYAPFCTFPYFSILVLGSLLEINAYPLFLNHYSTVLNISLMHFAFIIHSWHIFQRVRANGVSFWDSIKAWKRGEDSDETSSLSSSSFFYYHFYLHRVWKINPCNFDILTQCFFLCKEVDFLTTRNFILLSAKKSSARSAGSSFTFQVQIFNHDVG